jgi:uncharacterized SAM-binding protein YcdF (DUF218 family)
MRWVMRWLLRMLVASGSLFVVLMAVQGAYWYRTLTAPFEIRQAEAVVVFLGGPGRIRKGYDLANQGMAPLLSLSPATERRIQSLDKRFAGTGKPPVHMVEDRATTTFENALLTGRLIEAHGIKHCLLVTERFHMPRSLLLLRMVLAGKGVRIDPAPVEAKPYAVSPLRWSVREQKRAYNEMIEFWGSLVEVINYKATGQLPEPGQAESGIIKYLRNALLLEIR